MTEPILDIQRLRKYFKGPGGLLKGKAPQVRALDGVTFDVIHGEIFGVVGESGCGKSTLGKTLLGIYRPTGGRVRFKGQDITRLSKRASIRIKSEIQYVYQDPGSSLDPMWKVRRLLAEPLFIHTNLDRKAVRERVREMLFAVGLGEEHLSLYPHEFSGGQQRRLGLARILCLNPSLVVLDEPTSGLDVSVQATILKLFLDLKERFDLTYIFISHNLSVVRMMCRRVAVMYAGRIVEMGDTAAIFDRPAHPYTRLLVSAIPVIGKKAMSEREVEGMGEPPNPEDFPPGCRFQPRCPYESEACRREMPDLRPGPDGRSVACHLNEING